MIAKIDNLLNVITMYKLMLYGLIVIASLAIVFSFTGVLQYSGWSMVQSVMILTVFCWFSNQLLAKFYGVPPNGESALITALILFCIFSPPQNTGQAGILALAAIIAMASKYVLAFRRRHIFNPAAVAAVITGAIGLQYASWWIANNIMWLPVLLFGLLVIRKIHKVYMFGVFFAVAFLAIWISQGFSQLSDATSVVTSWPLLFLGMIMLTEPMTTPPTRRLQLIYAGIVGILMLPGLHAGMIYITPELALIIGNIFSFAVGIKQRPSLKLLQKNQLAQNIIEFVFEPKKRFVFSAGQYLEFTLPLKKEDFRRGNRRTFTIASSPTEKNIRLGIKFYNPSSDFKNALKKLEPGVNIGISQVAGDFTLPGDTSKKIAFIAGGIGITPFRSMLKQLIDNKQKRDIVLFYSVSDPDQIVFKEVFNDAKQHGLKPVYVLDKDPIPPSWQGKKGRITPELIKKLTPDFKNRLFYISGPVAMVNGTKKMLLSLGVARNHIIADYFSGY